MVTDTKANESLVALSRRIDEILGDKADFQLSLADRLEIGQLKSAIYEIKYGSTRKEEEDATPARRQARLGDPLE